MVKNFREENLESSGASESQSSAEPFVKLGVPGDVWRWGEFVRMSSILMSTELCIYLKDIFTYIIYIVILIRGDYDHIFFVNCKCLLNL